MMGLFRLVCPVIREAWINDFISKITRVLDPFS